MTKTPLILIRFVIAAVIAASYSGLSCHSAVAQQRMGIPAPKETILPAEDVDLAMIRFHRLPMIELMVNDTGPYQMVLDTGAAGVVLQAAIAKKLELPTPEGMPPGMRVQTPGGSVPATIHNIKNLKIGSAKFVDVFTIATELPFGDEVDGVIGMNVFKECLLTYDYPGNRVVLSRGELPESNNKDILNYQTPRMQDSHPYIDLTINGETKSTFVDSGFSAWFAVARKNKDEFKFLSGPVEAGMGQSVGPKRTHSEAGRIEASFEVGEFTVKDPIVLLGNEQMVGTLFLENFVVTFDAKNKRVRLARESNEALTQPAMRSLGFRLMRTGDDMNVLYIHPKSDASTKGLTVDGVVLEIAGKPAREVYDTVEFQEMIQSESSVPIRFKEKGNAEVKEIEVSILELLK